MIAKIAITKLLIMVHLIFRQPLVGRKKTGHILGTLEPVLAVLTIATKRVRALQTPHLGKLLGIAMGTFGKVIIPNEWLTIKPLRALLGAPRAWAASASRARVASSELVRIGPTKG
ncbi:hypothetical protein BAUCODRAFT_220401 [Baudoinia panamericana UAMH 10762]|uniref:Secreted protein n=1 Tax=Baudoinia panamericana (strain UAMH 10762) TaxID=717646 RepID=M2N5Q0_BAUPA|nr:uncharacterized protein BAUCODRAFT_220401 [Baudoinia panamericana UAMH 10762]EMC94085.1 hypothetical protein BAUCODRAFT_220401 [Baudoinia panamericana UAMH 10762]